MYPKSLHSLLGDLLERLDLLLQDNCKITKHIELTEFIHAAWMRLKSWENDIKNEDKRTLEKLPDLSLETTEIVRSRMITLSRAVAEVESKIGSAGAVPLEELRNLVKDVFRAAVNISRLTRSLMRLIDSDKLTSDIKVVADSQRNKGLGAITEPISSLGAASSPQSNRIEKVEGMQTQTFSKCGDMVQPGTEISFGEQNRGFQPGSISGGIEYHLRPEGPETPPETPTQGTLASPDVTVPDFPRKHPVTDFPAFLKACEDHDLDTMRDFLNDRSKLIDLDTTASDCTVLHLVIGNADVDEENMIKIAPAVKELIIRGANLNAPDPYGATPLHYCAITNNIEAAKLLLDKSLRSRKARVNNVDYEGKTALHWLAEAHRPSGEFAELLIQRRGKIGKGMSIRKPENDFQRIVIGMIVANTHPWES